MLSASFLYYSYPSAFAAEKQARQREERKDGEGTFDRAALMKSAT